MILPKAQILSTLKELGYPVKQGSQDAIAESPSITFRIDDNTPQYDLSNEIVSQGVVATVDIWSDDSVTASTISSEVEEAMRKIKYRMTYSADVPRPAGALFHIQCRFQTWV